MNCVYCEEVIAPDDVPGLHSMSIMHYECSIRAIAGSVAHQRRQCSCFGGIGHDNPMLTTRQNARRACEEWHTNRARSAL